MSKRTYESGSGQGSNKQKRKKATAKAAMHYKLLLKRQNQ